MGRELPPPGGLLGRRRLAELLPQRAAGERHRQPQQRRLRRIPYLFPDATILEPGTFSHEVVSRSDIADLGRHARAGGAPSFTWGNRVANAPPNNQGPFSNFILDTRVVQPERQPDARCRVATRSRPATTTSRATSAAARARFSARSTSRTTPTTRSTPAFGFANAALGIFSSYSQLSRWGEGAYTADQSRSLRPGQLEGQDQPDARLRHPLRAPGAAVRRLSARARTSCPRSGSAAQAPRALRRRLRQRRVPVHRAPTVRR